MGWTRIALTEEEQRVVKEDREFHPDRLVRRRMLAIWLLHCGMTRGQAAEIIEVSRGTIERYVADYRDHGLDRLRSPRQACPRESEWAAYRDEIRQSLEERPVRTTAEARQRIFELTGIRRGLTQTRHFLQSLGMRWQRVRAIPIPPKKLWRNTLPNKAASLPTS